MNPNESLVAALTQNLEMLKMTLADFSDTDLVKRPTPTANNAAWQLGHLAVSEVMMMKQIGAKMPELPAGFGDRFSAKTCGQNDLTKLGTKAELLDCLAKTRAATISWAQAATAQQLDQPSPERMRSFAPTAGLLLFGCCSHTMMHIGQLQVLRRALGKPILF